MSTTTSFLKHVGARAADHYLLNVGDPTTILMHSLALTTSVSANSTVTQEHQRAFELHSNQKWRGIGQGQCGTVFEETGTITVLKKANSDDPGVQAWIWNDFKRSAIIREKLLEFGVFQCRIPKVFGFYNHKSSFWTDNQEWFLERDAANSGRAMLAERILPIPHKIRHALIEKYCPEKIRASVHQSPANNDCLVRLLIGRRRDKGSRPKMFFSLRNFGLTADMMEELKLPIKSYLDPMTEALAAMHFAAKVDARDVEFVLGSEPLHLDEHQTADRINSMVPGFEMLPTHDLKKRILSVWCLDFNQVQDITMDEAGMRKAMEAFCLNDPYFPRPFDVELWSMFKSAYIFYSTQIIDGLARKPNPSLPSRFLQLVEDEYKRRMQTVPISSGANDATPEPWQG